MSDKAIAIYCFIDDFFKIIGRSSDALCRTKDAEIFTAALMAALYFHGNQWAAMQYMQAHHHVCHIHKSGFNRRLHRHLDTLTALFYSLSRTVKEMNLDARYLIDSFPVAVCDNIRIIRSKLLEGKMYRGKRASQPQVFLRLPHPDGHHRGRPAR
jgi:hypothetical protein